MPSFAATKIACATQAPEIRCLIALTGSSASVACRVATALSRSGWLTKRSYRHPVKRNGPAQIAPHSRNGNGVNPRLPNGVPEVLDGVEKRWDGEAVGLPRRGLGLAAARVGRSLP